MVTKLSVHLIGPFFGPQHLAVHYVDLIRGANKLSVHLIGPLFGPLIGPLFGPLMGALFGPLIGPSLGIIGPLFGPLAARLYNLFVFGHTNIGPVVRPDCITLTIVIPFAMRCGLRLPIM